LVSLYSTIKMMHGPINIRLTALVWIHITHNIKTVISVQISYKEELNGNTSDTSDYHFVKRVNKSATLLC